jgi:subtilisin family serine protease
VEVDPVRHLLAGRPSLAWGPHQDAALLAHRKAARLALQQQQQQDGQVGAGSTGSAPSDQQQQQQQQPVQRRLHPSTARKVVTDWSGAQLILDPYAAWAPGDPCAARDVSLAPLPGVFPPIGEVVPWGVAMVLQDPAPTTTGWDSLARPSGRPYDSRDSRQGQGLYGVDDTRSSGSASRLGAPQRGTRLSSLEGLFPPPRPGASAAPSPVNSRRANIIQCIIDSGLERLHEEYERGLQLPPNGSGGQWASVSRTAGGANNLLSGCNTTASSAGCAFPWSSDTVGHGTHVTGTIAAPRNGKGVVGITPGGAEVYVVRIWDTTGDVSQGEGPYASDLVAAYQSCRAYLVRRKKNEPDRTHRMVVNLSFGSPGPLSVEEAYLAAAAAQEDMLFVGAAGNNGTGGADWTSYPASYPWVISVANADCRGNVVLSSQRNAQVDVAAPGTAVLSSVAAKSRAMRAALSLNGRSLSASALEAARPPARDSLASTQRNVYLPEEVSAAAARGAEAAAAGVFSEPRPLVGTLPGQKTAPLAACNVRPLLLTLNRAQVAAPAINTATTGAGQEATAVRESRKAAGVAALKAARGCPGVSGKLCLAELPSQVDDYTEVCLAHLACLKGNATGILVYARNGDDPMFNLDGKEVLPRLQANCGTRCACWGVLSELLGGKALPLAAVIGAGQGRALAAQLADDATPGPGSPRPGPLTATLSVFSYPYRHFDGTSMATPHVTGVAARLWATRPTCNASQVRRALQEGTMRMPAPIQGEVGLGSGMVNLPLAQRRLAALNC